MAELTIVIKDVGNPNNPEVEIQCTGDTKIIHQATPAQILANDCMKFVQKKLDS